MVEQIKKDQWYDVLEEIATQAGTPGNAQLGCLVLLGYIVEDIPFGKLNTTQTYKFLEIGLKNITSVDKLESSNELILNSLELITATAERWET